MGCRGVDFDGDRRAAEQQSNRPGRLTKISPTLDPAGGQDALRIHEGLPIKFD